MPAAMAFTCAIEGGTGGASLTTALPIQVLEKKKALTQENSDEDQDIDGG